MTYDHYSEFTDDVDLDLQDIFDKIEEGVKYVWEKWDDTIAAKGLDSNWGWISPGAKLAYEHFKGKLEDEVKKLWDDFEKFCEDLWEKVEELAGDPFRLMEMNGDYLKAASRLRDEKTVIRDLTTEVSKHWSGDAYDSYVHVAKEEQLFAIQGVDAALVKAATACAEGAQQVRAIWRDLIDALLSAADTIFDGIKDGTDAGQWVTFDAGPAIKIIGKCLTEAIRLWNNLDRYFDTNATVKKSMWTDLNNGVDGLDANNEWPKISGRDKSDMGNKGDWGQK